MAVATYTDVGVALRRTISDAAEQAQITHWLTGAEMAIRSRLGDPALLDQDVLKYVETEVVAAKALNWRADGVASESVAIDDGSVTRRYDPVTDADFIPVWWSMLSPAGGSSAYTIAVSSPLDVLP